MRVPDQWRPEPMKNLGMPESSRAVLARKLPAGTRAYPLPKEKIMIRSRKQYWRNITAALALALGLMMPISTPQAQVGSKIMPTSTAQAQAGNNLGNTGVIPPNAKPYGKSYGEWGARFAQWLSSIPAPDNPLLNPAASCSTGQSGPVWFLPPNTGGTNTAYCTVPTGKAIFFSLTGYIANYPCPFPGYEPVPGQSLKDFLTQVASYYGADHTTQLEVEVDGVPLKNLFSYRGTSDLFYLTEDPSLIVLDPCDTGTPQPAVSDGYWIMLAPPSVGNHTIHVFGKQVFTQAQDGFDLTLTFENNFYLTVGS
jgi:hypothetical protein